MFLRKEFRSQRNQKGIKEWRQWLIFINSKPTKEIYFSCYVMSTFFCSSRDRILHVSMEIYIEKTILDARLNPKWRPRFWCVIEKWALLLKEKIMLLVAQRYGALVCTQTVMMWSISYDLRIITHSPRLVGC